MKIFVFIRNIMEKIFIKIIIITSLVLVGFWVYDSLREKEVVEIYGHELFKIEPQKQDTLILKERTPSITTTPQKNVFVEKDLTTQIKELITYIVGLVNSVLGTIILYRKVFMKNKTTNT